MAAIPAPTTIRVASRCRFAVPVAISERLAEIRTTRELYDADQQATSKDRELSETHVLIDPRRFLQSERYSFPSSTVAALSNWELAHAGLKAGCRNARGAGLPRRQLLQWRPDRDRHE